MLKGGVVGTLMSNYGLEKLFKEKKLNLLEQRLETDMLKRL